MSKKLLATLVATSLLFTGCGPDKTGGSYDDVEALRDAFVKAGGSCDDWNLSNKVNGAAQSGECGTDTVLSTYLTHDAVQDRIAETKESIFGEMGGEWLTGENWVINTDDVRGIQKKMGGTIVSFSNEEDE